MAPITRSGTRPARRVHFFARGLAALTLVLVVTSAPRPAAQTAAQISARAAAQVGALLREKMSRTPAQRKMDSHLVYALRQARRDPAALQVPMLQAAVPTDGAGLLTVDIRADVSNELIDQIEVLGGEVESFNVTYRAIRARVPFMRLEALAELPHVQYVGPKERLLVHRARPASGASGLSHSRSERSTALTTSRTALVAGLRGVLDPDIPVAWAGSVTSQGDATHRASQARTQFGVSGVGVRIGVLSDGVASLAASQGRGDLGAVTVLPGQEGPADGDEGTAMLEIVHDLAPDAQLYFATAFDGSASFAQNIRALQAAGCGIIVDDVRYFAESPFQDGQTGTSPTNGGIIAQAVKDVAALGVLYFSSAGNGGNKNDGTSGTWEGDFVDGGDASFLGSDFAGARLHNFGGATFTALTAPTDGRITLHWADPLGQSTNDYDLFLLDSSGMPLAWSTNEQSAAFPADPYEGIDGVSAGQRLMVVKYSGAPRFLHLATNGGGLSLSTAGEIMGHAATTALNSFAVAAVDANLAYPNAFSGSNQVESFSSDGPRRIFFNGAGAAFTPGVFTAAGGLVLQKPDLAAADGVATSIPWPFNPFYGTSAAAPHAAAVAALIKSRKPNAPVATVRAALFSSVIDIEAPGRDRDSGVGIVMADGVAAMPLPRRQIGDFDGDGRADLTVFRPSLGTWYTANAAGGTVAVNWGVADDVPAACDYDGDRRADVAVFRPAAGTWFIRFSTGGTAAVLWGTSGDVPVPADYDGDGRCDVAVYRPSTGNWYLRFSSGEAAAVHWGVSSDQPVPGDYDGDRKADIAVWRKSTGTWFVRFSSNGSAAAILWGIPTDVAVPADYDGDGTTDIAIYRPSGGAWYIRYSRTGATAAFAWGISTDQPVPGDYDGDDIADLAVFRPSTGAWHILNSSNGSVTALLWGNAADKPISQRP